MPARGRPPKPVELKIRNGNPGKRALPAPVSVLPALHRPPPIPAVLGEDGARLWDNVWTLGRPWLCEQDYPLVLEAALLVDEIAGHRADVAQHGRLIQEPILYRGEETGHTVMVANPALKSQRLAEAQLLRYLIDLAIPPTARARLGLTQVKAESKLREFLGS